MYTINYYGEVEIQLVRLYYIVYMYSETNVS